MATKQEDISSSRPSSVSMVDVLEDMEIVRRYSSKGTGSKHVQTTLTSFVVTFRKTESKAQVTPPISKRPCTSSVQPGSANSIDRSSTISAASNGLGRRELRSGNRQVKNEQSKEDTGRSNQGGKRDKQVSMATTKAEESKPKKMCPFYKKVPGTGFTVDAFRYGIIPGCVGYFLSHFHSDHYQGLNRRFQGTLYCTKITANLVIQQLRVPAACVHPLSLNHTHLIEDVQVTLLEANHCPGAVLLLFKLASGRMYLHTGDFRYSASMLTYPQLSGILVHELYLDTTYCNPKYNFPTQEEAISYAVAKSMQAVELNPNTLIVCGTYTIGKEKVFQAIAEALCCEVCVSKEKKAILDCLECDWMTEHVHTDPHSGRVHVLPIGKLNMSYLTEYLKGFSDQYTALLAFKPTGWMYHGSLSTIKPHISGNISIYGIPYSEHSSYTELCEFVQFLRPLKIIPTVDNSSPKRREEMQTMFREWLTPTHTSKQTTLLDSFRSS